MKTKLFLIAGSILLAAALFYWRFPVWSIQTKVLVLAGVGFVSAVVLAVMLSARLGAEAGHFVYPTTGKDSGQSHKVPGEAKAGESALWLVEKGDYAGALASYERHLQHHPLDVLATIEAANLRAEKLGDAMGAVAFLQERLGAHPWGVADCAALRFRLAEIQLKRMNDSAAALKTLNDILAECPDGAVAARVRHELATLH